MPLQQLCTQCPDIAKPSGWSDYFAKQLNALGWPGERSLDSHEYQLVQRCQLLFNQFASLDGISPPIQQTTALYHWQQLAQSIVFQFKSAQPQVHILGTLEAVGLSFDHTWIMGLHDGAWPTPAKANPFLPLQLQRSLNLPGSSAARELQFTQQLMQRLSHSAAEVILSYPSSDGDNPQQASRLLAPFSPLPSTEIIPSIHHPLSKELYALADIESLADNQAPAILPDEKIRGGSQIFKLQATCPFRAFAELRLGAHGLAAPSHGLDALARGNLVHHSLELIWQQLGDQKTLLSHSDAALQQLISQQLQRALRRLAKDYLQPLSPTLLDLEQQRLQAILLQWLTLEKTRAPFSVIATEQRETIRIGDLSIDVMLDRKDKVGDNTLIIDYKTGTPSVYAWLGQRPDEPQLPLYCVSSDTPIHGILFAQVRSNKLQFKGIIEDPSWVPKSEAPSDFTEANDEQAWDTLQQEWQMVLHDLAQQFVHGTANVDPKDPVTSCQYCELQSLCRIHEQSYE